MAFRRFIAALMFAFGLSIPLAAANAAQFPDGADAFVQKLGDRAIASLTRPGMNRHEMEANFREIFDQSFDVTAIGKFVLGKYWRQATDAQQSDFLKLFEELIVRTYSARFREYTGETLHVTGLRSDSPQQAIVTAEIQRPQGPPIRVDWRVGQNANGSMRVYDVVIEGVSMSVTQRAEFASVIQRSGGEIEGLLNSLRDKIVSLDKTR